VTRNLYQRHIKPLFIDHVIAQQPVTQMTAGRLIATT
jgi:hypothetical protein